MSRQIETPRSIDELVDRLLMVVVDLGWTPPGWRPSRDEDSPPVSSHRAWLLERLGDLAYLLAQHTAEREAIAQLDAGGERPSGPAPLN